MVYRTVMPLLGKGQRALAGAARPRDALPNLVALEVHLRDGMKSLGVPGDVQVAVSVDATVPFFRKRRQVEVLATSIAKCAAAKAAEVSVESPARVTAADVAPPGASEQTSSS